MCGARDAGPAPVGFPASSSMQLAVIMNEIKCPHCGQVFQVDESGYADIVRQVRDDEFKRDLQQREEQMAIQRDQAVKLAQAEADNRAQRDAAQQDALIAQLKAQLEAADSEKELFAKSAVAEAEKQRDALASQLAGKESEMELMRSQLEARRAQDVSARDAEIAQLKAQAESRAAQMQREFDREKAGLQGKIEAQASAFAAEKQLAVTTAVAEAERQRDELASELKLKDAEKSQATQELQLQMAEQLKAKDVIIADKDQQIEHYRDLKARLSTKMLGESLEQHCEMEFNRIRATAFPRAYFEKDNEVAEGTKGDFIFRDFDESGAEVLSIMFEMKNEQEDSTHRHRNEDFFKKLDSDRTKKNCEYAVLVTLLEPESELYNAGIVDVSYRYPKMYVIRPQFFIPIISILRNASMGAMEARRELALVRQQNIDITHFEEQMESFKTDFGKNFETATRKFNTAIEEIDKTITHLQKVKDNLTSWQRQLRLANDKAEKLTIKRLTRGNPTMKAKFDELKDADPDAGANGKKGRAKAKVAGTGGAADAPEAVRAGIGPEPDAEVIEVVAEPIEADPDAAEA